MAKLGDIVTVTAGERQLAALVTGVNDEDGSYALRVFSPDNGRPDAFLSNVDPAEVDDGSTSSAMDTPATSSDPAASTDQAAPAPVDQPPAPPADQRPADQADRGERQGIADPFTPAQ